MLSNRISVFSVIAFIIFSLPIGKCDAVGLPSITIAGITDYRPYSYYENNEPKGLYNDILIELFRRSGYPLRIKLVPFKRLLWMTENGDVSGMAGAFWNKEREQFATFLLEYPLGQISSSLFVKEKSELDSTDIKELEGKVVGRKRGFIMTPNLDKAYSEGKFKLIEVETTEQLIKMLKLSRIDVVCHTTNNIRYYLKTLDVEDEIQQLIPPVLNGRESYLAFSNKALDKLPERFFVDMQIAFESMRVDGTIETLKKKHNIWAFPTDLN